MRIAIFTDNFYPELSGISDSVISLAKELVTRGHTIHFYAPKYSAADFQKSNLPMQELDLGPKVGVTRFSSFYFGAGSGQGRGVIPLGLRALEVRAFNPSVIHTQTFFGTGVEALIASRALGVPLVGTNHTAIKNFLIYNPIKTEWMDNGIVKYVNWYYEQCITVTAPSQSVFNEMKETGFKKRGIPLSNPIDTETFKPLTGREALRKKFGIGPFAIVHAGRLAHERSIDILIRALPLVRKAVPE